MPRVEGSEVEGKLPESATEDTAAVTMSVTSVSLMVSEPFAVRLVSVSPRAARSPAEVSLAEISGVSLVPVMVMATVVVLAAWESEPKAPLLSVRVRV